MSRTYVSKKLLRYDENYIKMAVENAKNELTVSLMSSFFANPFINKLLLFVYS